MKQQLSLNDKIVKLLEEERLDSVIETLIVHNSLDDILLAISNILVFKANKCKTDSKEYNKIIKKAKLFHAGIEDLKKASVSKRKKEESS